MFYSYLDTFGFSVSICKKVVCKIFVFARGRVGLIKVCILNAEDVSVETGGLFTEDRSFIGGIEALGLNGGYFDHWAVWICLEMSAKELKEDAYKVIK